MSDVSGSRQQLLLASLSSPSLLSEYRLFEIKGLYILRVVHTAYVDEVVWG